ncbi:hypothetical protein CLOM_g22955 [Closterium sp. NIES-68]|nr:hypothetical protein CLOM_g22955 [Closterium sp. NIES-68]
MARSRGHGVALLSLVALLVLGPIPPVSPSVDAPTLHECDTSDPLFSPLPLSTDHAHRYHRPPHLCWSKGEIPCYAGSHGMAARSETLKRKLRAYQEYRRDCDMKENVTALKKKLRAGNATECKYLLWHFRPGDGQGNQYISLVSAFVYALLTNRVFLLLTELGPGKLMCQPFEGPQWFVYSDVKDELWDATLVGIRISYQYFPDRVTAIENGTSDTMDVPNIAAVSLHHNMPNTSIFFCESEQRWLSQVPSILLLANQYYLPALFYHPSFRRHIKDLFPSGRIFQTVSQLIMFPNNRLWAAITDNIHRRAAPAAARLGLQLRHCSEGIIAQAAECVVQVVQGEVVEAARRVRVKGVAERDVAVEPGGLGGGGEGVGGGGAGGGVEGAAGVGSGGVGQVSGEPTAYGMGMASEEGTAAAVAAALAFDGGASPFAAGVAAPGDSSSNSGTTSGSGGSVGGSTVVLIAALDEYAPYNLSLLLFPPASSPQLTYTKIIVTDHSSNGSSSETSSSNGSSESSTGTSNDTQTDPPATANSTAAATPTSTDTPDNSTATLDLAPVSTVLSIPASSSNITNSTIISNGTLSLDRLTTETWQSGLDPELEHAVIDIYTVALASDAILVFPSSTFGYLLAGLFARPAFFVAHNCQPAPLEPCYHHPPQPHQCAAGGQAIGGAYNESDPDLPFSRCPDMPNGMSLLYTGKVP